MLSRFGDADGAVIAELIKSDLEAREIDYLGRVQAGPGWLWCHIVTLGLLERRDTPSATQIGRK